MAALSESVRHKFRETFGINILQSYGTSELMLVSCQARGDHDNDVGTPLNDVNPAVVVDNDGLNELVVKSPFEFKGYLNEDGFLAPARSSSGNVLTGDLANIIGERVYITGRKKDLIIRGGVNISPSKIENILCRINQISEIAVVGVPHPFWGEEIVAFVVIGSNSDKDLLMREIEKTTNSLSKHEKPDRFIFVDSLPRTASGKIRKHMLVIGT
jgi:long-chain acyl-CoA synthetase